MKHNQKSDANSMGLAREVAEQFAEGTLTDIRKVPGGHIHISYLVEFIDKRLTFQILLQRINTEVFKDPIVLSKNLELVTAALGANEVQAGDSVFTQMSIPKLIRTNSGELLVKDKDGGFWRAFQYLTGCSSFERTPTPQHAYEAALLLGEFHRRLIPLSPRELGTVIPDFQNLGRRFDTLKAAASNDTHRRLAKVQKWVDLAVSQEGQAFKITELLTGGSLPKRVTHADPKISNFLFNSSGCGMALVDLDTCMEGSILYDFGDFVRSVTPNCAEDEQNPDFISVNADLLRLATKGYLKVMGYSLSPAERRLLPIAPKVIAMTLGTRFLTDHLEGDWYFQIERPQQNLERGIAQFTLAERFGELEGLIEEVINQ